jgi:predicted site-specific integrase-resolvase
MIVQKNQSNRLRSYGGWLSELGISRSTGWRWRKLKLLITHRIGGRLFVEQDDIDRLYQQARAGELAHLRPPTDKKRRG